MPLLRCRKCSAEIIPDVADCPKCGCHYPFTCAVCGEPTGMLEAIGWSHPFTKHGEPLCSQHTQRLCDKCKQPFPPESLTQRTAHWELIATTGDYILIPGAFCQGCNATHTDPPKPEQKKKKGLGCASVVALLIILGVGVPILCIPLLH